MKAQLKAIVASAVVIALCLAAVGGVTYSWFSDTEQSDITINTAKVDYEITSIDIGNIVGYANAAVGTNNTIQITNLAAACTIPIQINITNNSTIETIYVVKAVFSDTTTDDEETWDEVKINGTPIRSAMEQTGDKIILLTEDWTVAQPSIGFNIPLRITSTEDYGDYQADEWASTQRNIIFSIVIEAYQGDMPVSSFGSIAGIAGSAATVPSNGIISGTIEMTGGESTQNVTTTVEFSSSNTYTASGISEATNTSGTNLGTSITKSGDGVEVGLTLYNGTNPISSPSFSAPVTINMVIPGDLTNNNTTTPSVTYNGEGTDPSNVTAFFDGTNTTISFDVTHFSKYIIKPVEVVKTEADLKNAIEAKEKIVVLGSDIQLTEELSISKNILNDISIIGLGHKIYGESLRISAENVSLMGIRFACDVEDQGGDASMLYVNTGNKNLLIDGCYFEDSQWDVLQYNSTSGEHLTITNCTFDDSLVNFTATGEDAFGNPYSKPANINRYIHIEPNTITNVNITITNNVFKVDNKIFGDTVFTIYRVPFDCMTFGNNVFDLPLMFAQTDSSIKNNTMYWISDGTDMSTLLDPHYLITGIPETPAIEESEEA